MQAPRAAITTLITDLPNGRHVVVDHRTRPITTYTGAGIVQQNAIKPGGGCAGSTTDVMLGYATLLEDKTLSLGDRSTRVQTWRAPDLNCLISRQEHSDSAGHSKMVL